jgi:hypothetical protein
VKTCEKCGSENLWVRVATWIPLSGKSARAKVPDKDPLTSVICCGDCGWREVKK